MIVLQWPRYFDKFEYLSGSQKLRPGCRLAKRGEADDGCCGGKIALEETGEKEGNRSIQ